ncbi:dihydrofolate reductase family protein [Eubacterium limosum]|uniref:dihydrofolate reductase family protein n=1 Tax=Eubacterium limosum TaxID=1736 RepID=UPI00372313D5
MRDTTLFIAMSLDGYIADKNGKVDWLSGHTPDADDMTSYSEFIKDIDTVVMGYNTYHQIVTELSPGDWPYTGLTTYVLTHRSIPSTKAVKFANEDTCSLVRALKQETGSGIWICGGAGVVQPLIRADMIDRFHLSMIPTILGDGIPLFETASTAIKLRLLETKSYNGITDLIYAPRQTS